MDFLDPRKRRQQHIRLWIGYSLMTLVVLLGTIILVYVAYGVGYDTKTGSIVENGLLFVDSHPGNASVYINGTDQHSNTAARLNLQAGKYNLTLKKDGYRDWVRNFDLEEHTVARYVYPFLFPQKLNPKVMKVYSTKPKLVSESPDRHWIVVKSPEAPLAFDLFDTTQPTKANTTFTLPAAVVTAPTSAGSTYTEVEWSTDNVHLLLKHDYTGGSEYIVLNRTSPTDSFNINKQLNINPTEVALRNKKIDTIYIYDGTAETLAIGDTKADTVAAPILKHVKAFKSYGNDLISYVTTTDVPEGKAQARIWDKDTSYPLYTFSAGDKYLIDAAQYQGDWYYVAGSNTSPLINVFKNPLDSLKNSSIGKASPSFALQETGATKVSFSTNTRFVMVEAGQEVSDYDFETQTSYRYTVGQPLTSSLFWMDGHRLMGISAGNVIVMDYDGVNQQTLVPAEDLDNSVSDFDDNYNQMFVAAPVTGSDSVTLNSVDLRAGSDLPK